VTIAISNEQLLNIEFKFLLISLRITKNMKIPGITIIGLGPGDPSLLTRQAWDLLGRTEEVYLRTLKHPTVAGFPEKLRVHSFDHYYEEGITFEEVYKKIVDTVLSLGRGETGVVYGVPGHPFIAEATTPEITRQARESDIPVTVIEGMSFVEATLGELGIDPFPQISLVDALELAIAHHPPFPPSAPAMIAQIHSPAVASDVKLTLMSVYPDEHEVKLVHGAGTQKALVETMSLYKIDRSSNIGLLTSLYLPPLERGTSFEAFQEIVAHLRAPEGCPWDREQTHQSLRPYLLEEAYEVLAALDTGDQGSLCEELGDLLLQVVLHAQIANEFSEFNMVDVLKGIHEKLIHRHPHVFRDLELTDKHKVLENWERLKLAERDDDGEEENGILAGMSLALPALAQADGYQEMVNRVGFDWPNIQGVYDKVKEELFEVKLAASSEQRESEIGDLLFAVVNLARWLNIDAESALRSANARFRKRFESVEAIVLAKGRDLSKLSLDELDTLWESVKDKED
jgi:tetrapyrrole methylase family protein/MazG family protein